ncbi:hypothetical protein QJS10_CPB18g01910 [Acorus calamus]|uniref:(S)-ureidoglycine aminohydrolase cupin domain-containing protein n=1 Tax=Acorus calamus TaxID=4465 RepID=A0AAV9CPZ4_ACOCL|nr:hypothetical protein QJS10_CPB18g01910 [Acorus calamus]
MAMETGETLVTPGEVLGDSSDLIAGRGAYVAHHNGKIYSSLTGRRSIVPPFPGSSDQKPKVEIVGHKAHGAVPEPGSVVIARLSLGDARAYYLSTAKNELGVVSAQSIADRSTDLCRPSETHFDWASVDTYSNSSTDLCCPGEEHFDWTLSNWVVGKDLTPLSQASLKRWGCPPGKFPMTFDAEETCYLLRGKVKAYMKGSTTDFVEFGAGDLVVIPKGLSCTWDVSVAVDKHYKFDSS